MTAIAHLQKAREWLALKVERDVHPNYDTLLEYVTHLEQQVERLQQANAGLARDAARLDWLDGVISGRTRATTSSTFGAKSSRMESQSVAIRSGSRVTPSTPPSRASPMIDQDAIARLRFGIERADLISPALGDVSVRLTRNDARALLALAEAVGNLPAPLINSQAWPTGYVDGYNDALIVVEQSLRILAAMPTSSSGGEKADA